MPHTSTKRGRLLRARLQVIGFALMAFVGGVAHAAGSADDVARGAQLYAQRCALCHGKQGEGGQGPSLAGVIGRKAAERPDFAYSPALRASGLVWTRPTLIRFLADPATMVPGTTMPIGTAELAERTQLLAFLGTLRRGPVAAPAARSGGRPLGDWRYDLPGTVHRISLAELPKPFATPSAGNGPRHASRPEEARPRAPDGFRVELFASGLQAPRVLRLAPNGDVFVAETAAGRVQVLRAGKDGRPVPSVFAKDLDQPFGMAFYPPGPSPAWVYVALNNAVVRFPYRGGTTPTGPAETVVARLSPRSGGHTTRDIAFTSDASRFFLSVGSESNVAEGEDKEPPGGVAAWEKAHGLGATWGDEESRAAVLTFAPNGTDRRPYANGIRNCVGLALEPATGLPWCATNERDGLGDDLVPDYITSVREGAFYGWPWYYLGRHPDPRHKGARPDLADKVTAPDVLLQAHSAALTLTFADRAAFPSRYKSGAFVALHGSWNRAQRTGYKVIFVPFEAGKPTGAYEDFLTGFVVDDQRVWGRPVGVAFAADGSLLVTEDGSGTIWRVQGPATSPR